MYRRKNINIEKRLEEAKAKGKFLDVSHLTPEGLGIRAIAPPTSRSKKVGPAGLGIVSSDPEKLQRVINMLGPSYAKWKESAVPSPMQSPRMGLPPPSPAPSGVSAAPSPMGSPFAPSPYKHVSSGKLRKPGSFKSLVAPVGSPSIKLPVPSSPAPEVSDTPDITEKSLSDFTLLKVLGKGSNGTVYQAIRKSDNKVIALKVVELKDLTEKQIQKAMQEVEFLRKLSEPVCNPFVVCYYGSYFDKKDKKFLIEMEYVLGIDMHDFRNSILKRYSEDVRNYYLLLIVKDLAAALEYIHFRGVLHNDIKLENTMIDPILTPKLIDFGLSCFTITDPKKGPHCDAQGGTVYYVAPEFIKTRRRYPASDMWSLGVLMYAFVTGVLPFTEKSDETAADVMTHIYNDPVPVLKTDNPLLDRIVNGLLVKDMNKRLTAKDVVEMLSKKPIPRPAHFPGMIVK